MIILKWRSRTAVLWRETRFDLMVWFDVNRVYVWESGNCGTRGTARWAARNNERAYYIYTMIPLSNLFLCWLWYCSLLVIGHTSLYIPLSPSQHGTWQRFLLCSLKFTPTHLRHCGSSGGRGGGGGGGGSGSDEVRGVSYCKTMYQRVNYKPKLLHVPVTIVRGPLVSSTRLIR